MAILAKFDVKTIQANVERIEAVKAAVDAAKHIDIGSVEAGKAATKRTRKAAEAVK